MCGGGLVDRMAQLARARTSSQASAQITPRHDNPMCHLRHSRLFVRHRWSSQPSNLHSLGDHAARITWNRSTATLEIRPVPHHSISGNEEKECRCAYSCGRPINLHTNTTPSVNTDIPRASYEP